MTATMEDNKLDKIALYLEIIADELYIARTERELEGASGSEPAMWNNGGRDLMVKNIEIMRNKAERM